MRGELLTSECWPATKVLNRQRGGLRRPASSDRRFLALSKSGNQRGNQRVACTGGVYNGPLPEWNDELAFPPGKGIAIRAGGDGGEGGPELKDGAGRP